MNTAQQLEWEKMDLKKLIKNAKKAHKEYEKSIYKIAEFCGLNDKNQEFERIVNQELLKTNNSDVWFNAWVKLARKK
tara:strand:- start:383 stop:613 length:231 start_codon:yes stop_codon:yes gene_type:complete